MWEKRHFRDVAHSKTMDSSTLPVGQRRPEVDALLAAHLFHSNAKRLLAELQLKPSRSKHSLPGTAKALPRHSASQLLVPNGGNHPAIVVVHAGHRTAQPYIQALR